MECESFCFKFQFALHQLPGRPNACVTFLQNDMVTRLRWIIYHKSTRQETKDAVLCYRANDSNSRQETLGQGWWICQ